MGKGVREEAPREFLHEEVILRKTVENLGTQIVKM